MLAKEILGNLAEATGNAIALIRAAVARFARIAEVPSLAHSALELAIWSDRARIDPAVKARLGPLLAKYL